MLRVRPLFFTSNFDATVTELLDLGLDCVENDGDRGCFDSGNGKLEVLRAARGGYAAQLAFELRDAAIFVRRTLTDGTHAELAETFYGPGARVIAPDGFSFELSASSDLAIPVPEAATNVTATWRTPNPAAANQVLANIGAKFVEGRESGGALFRAKNGGFVATAAGEVAGVELSIHHGGGIHNLGAQSEP